MNKCWCAAPQKRIEELATSDFVFKMTSNFSGILWLSWHYPIQNKVIFGVTDLTDVSAKTKQLHIARIVFVIAETSARSARKQFIFIIWNNFLGQFIKSHVYLIWKTESLVAHCRRMESPWRLTRHQQWRLLNRNIVHVTPENIYLYYQHIL